MFPTDFEFCMFSVSLSCVFFACPHKTTTTKKNTTQSIPYVRLPLFLVSGVLFPVVLISFVICLCACVFLRLFWLRMHDAADGKRRSAGGLASAARMPTSPSTPSHPHGGSGSLGGSLKIGRPRSRSKSPFRSFRWKRGSSRAPNVDSDDEEHDGGNQRILYILYSFLSAFRNRSWHTATTVHKCIYFDRCLCPLHRLAHPFICRELPTLARTANSRPNDVQIRPFAIASSSKSTIVLFRIRC